LRPRPGGAQSGALDLRLLQQHSVGGGPMSETKDLIRFTLDGQEITALPGETVWQAARRAGTDIAHLCHLPEPGYRPDGNCRACMVEVEGERVLAASCIRKPTPGMVVHSASHRAEKARAMVFELLLADLPAREAAPDPDAPFWQWAERVGVTASRFANGRAVSPVQVAEVVAHENSGADPSPAQVGCSRLAPESAGLGQARVPSE